MARTKSKDGPPRHFLRAWRKAKGHTLEQVAERIGMTSQNLGKVERGLVPYTQTLLELLAVEYGTEPASLIMRDPADPAGIWSVHDTLSSVERAQLVEMAKVLRRTGTNG